MIRVVYDCVFNVEVIWVVLLIIKWYWCKDYFDLLNFYNNYVKCNFWYYKKVKNNMGEEGLYMSMIFC